MKVRHLLVTKDRYNQYEAKVGISKDIDLFGIISGEIVRVIKHPYVSREIMMTTEDWAREIRLIEEES